MTEPQQWEQSVGLWRQPEKVTRQITTNFFLSDQRRPFYICLWIQTIYRRWASLSVLSRHNVIETGRWKQTSLEAPGELQEGKVLENVSVHKVFRPYSSEGHTVDELFVCISTAPPKLKSPFCTWISRILRYHHENKLHRRQKKTTTMEQTVYTLQYPANPGSPSGSS